MTVLFILQKLYFETKLSCFPLYVTIIVDNSVLDPNRRIFNFEKAQFRYYNLASRFKDEKFNSVSINSYHPLQMRNFESDLYECPRAACLDLPKCSFPITALT